MTQQNVSQALRRAGNPGRLADGTFDVGAWREYFAAMGHSVSGGDPEMLAAKRRQILLLNDRLETRIARERGELIPMESAKRIFGKLVMEAKNRSFGGVMRFVTLARTAADSASAGEEIRKELALIWKSLEDGGWQ